MPASKLVNWLEEPAEFAGWELLVALAGCGLLIRRSGLSWAGLFLSGIPISPIGHTKNND
jgi:hypothetical protein